MIGRTLDHYRIEAKLGAGGMGVVYRAHDAKLQRTVAIKLLSGAPDEAGRARLLREARAAAALNHPHIGTVYEVAQVGDQAFLVMEFVGGESLREVIQRGRLPSDAIIRYGVQIADALAHAHDHGILHRDLKSANVLLTRDGQIKVLDFGLAVRLQESELEQVTRTRASLAGVQIGGTLPYMAPEVLRGQPSDARSDIWALGVVLHELASRELPFQGTTGFDLTAAILDQPPTALPATVPAALRAVIRRCLAKEPGQRYQRASEVRAALETVGVEAAVTPFAARAPAVERHAVARVTRRWGAVAAVLLAAVVVAAVWFWSSPSREQPSRDGPPPRIASLAVLPLKNLSGDPAQTYFVEGMQEELTTQLSKIRALRVVSRTSTLRYQQTTEPLPEIARALSVDGLIE